MNRLSKPEKINSSQSKSKIKIPSPSPSAKPRSKLKESVNLGTPRSNKNHAIQPKKYFDVKSSNIQNKVKKQSVFVQEDKTDKQYDTPKFKQCKQKKAEQMNRIKISNFFSFGQQDNFAACSKPSKDMSTTKSKIAKPGKENNIKRQV